MDFALHQEIRDALFVQRLLTLKPPKRRRAPFKGRINIGDYSSIRKRMRKARRH